MQMLECDAFLKAIFAMNIWMSSGSTDGSLHFDQYDNIQMQIAGEKLVTLINRTLVRL